MEIQGKVIAVLPERSGVSARGEWKSQTYVIETQEQYPKKMAFDVFGADRIGHGTAAGESIETMLYIKEKNVCVEVCPISNRLSKAVKENNYHPVLQFIEHGVPFVLCSDNPSIHNKSINDDYLSFYHESKRKDILDEMFKIQNKYKFLKV